MAKKIQDGNQIVTNVDSNDNLTFSIKNSFIDSTPTVNSTNLVTSGGVKSALDINTTDIAAAVIRIANNETNISNNTDDIEDLEDAVSTNTTNISTNTTDIDNLETTVGTLSTNVNANTTKIGTLSNLTTTSKTNLVSAINELNAPEKWVSVGTTAPTDGRKVWFKKGKNLFDGQLELGMYDTTTGAKATNNANYRNVAPINVQPNTTYTFSINGTSQKYVIYLYKKDGTFISANASLTSGTFTTPAETYLLNFRCFNADFTSDYANLKIQLEKGSTATSYEPYIEPSINVDGEEWYNPNNIEKYSTDEIKIGTWIDGKPLYRKVITFGALANNGNTSIPYGSSNNLIKFDIYAKNPTGNYLFKVPLGGTNYINSYVEINSHIIVVQTNSDRTNVTDNYVIIEYTKTTD